MRSRRHQGNKDMNHSQTQRARRSLLKSTTNTHTHTQKAAVRPGFTLITITVVPKAIFSSLYRLPRRLWLISPRVHCSAGSYRCPPRTPISLRVCVCVLRDESRRQTGKSPSDVFFMLRASPPPQHTSTKSLTHQLPAGRRWG